MSFSIRRFPTTGSRVDHSLEGWSIIEKITDFTHAVCRASNGKGSAILIALPRQPRQQFVFLESVDGQPGPGPRQKAQQMEEEQIGVLLTTSFVLPSKEEGQRTTMTFLEQPVVGSDARYGYVVEPFEVAVRSDKVFVCSTGRAVSGEVMSYTSQGATPARESSSARESNRGPYSTGDMSDLHQEALNGDYAEEEIGYSFTLCDMRPLYQPPLAKHRSHSFSAVNQKQRCLPSDTRNAPSPSMGTVLPPLQKLTSTQAARYGETCHASAEASRTGVRGIPRTQTRGHGTAAVKRRRLPIEPLPLPLLLSRVPPVNVGDTHLMVTHVNGMRRHYVVQTVKSVGSHSCEYDFSDPSSEYSSGGPIFDMQGNFVGLQHQVGDYSCGILISSIVHHLFHSMLLGICRLPIAEMPTHTEDDNNMRQMVPEEEFNQPFHVNQLYSVFSVGAGDQLIPYEEFKRPMRHDDRQDIDLWPLIAPPRSDLVWKEFYTDFESIFLILHSFSHAPQIIKLALWEMCNQTHVKDLCHTSSYGGIGLLLEIIDGYPKDAEIISSAVVALARCSLFELNREAIVCCDGLLTLLHIMDEYTNNKSILHYGFCCLCNLMDAESSTSADAIDFFVRCDGIDLAIEALCVHKEESHVLRHTALALSCVVCESDRHVHTMLDHGITQILIERMKSKTEDEFAFLGLVTLLRKLLNSVLENNRSTRSSLLMSSSIFTEDQMEMDVPRLNTCTSTSSTCRTEAGRALVHELTEGNVLALLARVMMNALETHSSAAVRLLIECVGSTVVLMRYCSVDSHDIEDMGLQETCRRIIASYPAEKLLRRMAGVIIKSSLNDEYQLED